MADRRDYYHRQPVTEAELDAGFAGGETADLSLATDWGLALVDASSTDGGVATGLVATLGVGLNLDVTAGAAYDNSGRRVRTASTLSVSQAQTGQTAIGAGGTPTGGVTTDPGLNLERWAMLSMSFDRALSDPRVDGGGATVQFVRAESFRFHVSMGNPAAFGAATRPALPSGQVVLCEILVRNTAGSVAFSGGVDTTRRQDWFVRGTGTTTRGGAGYPVRSMRVGLPRAALDHLLGVYNDHVRRDASTGDFHFAKNVEFESAGLAWANAEAFAAWAAGAGAAGAGLTAGVQNAIDEIVRDLGGTGAASGAHRLGTAAIAGTRPAGAVGAADAVVAGTLTAALTVLLAAINRGVRLDGDTVTGAIVPNVTGVALGSAGARFDLFARNLDLTNLVSDVGTGGTNRTLGANSTGNRFTTHMQDASLRGTLTTSVDTRVAGSWEPDVHGQVLGATGRRWNLVGGYATLEPQTAATALSVAAMQVTTTASDTARFTNKFGTETLAVTRVGHLQQRLGGFRDDFVYALSSGTGASSPTSGSIFGDRWRVLRSTDGTITDVVRDGALGTLQVRALNLGVGAVRASINTDALVLTPGATVDTRVHFAARVLNVAFSTTSGRIWVGLVATSDVDFAVGGTPTSFGGFFINRAAAAGPLNWHVYIDGNDFDTGLAFTAGLTRLEMYMRDATTVEFSIVIEGGGSTSGTRTGVSIAAVNCTWLTRAEITPDNQTATVEVDYVEIVRG